MILELPLAWDDHWAGWDLGRVGGYELRLLPTIYNHRLVLVSEPLSWDVGWCYPDLESALSALSVWDPTSGVRPPGAIKEVGLSTDWDAVLRRLRQRSPLGISQVPG